MAKAEFDANKQYLKDFIHCLVENEEAMAENAAMAVTCDMFGIDIEDGYELLMQADSEGLFEEGK